MKCENCGKNEVSFIYRSNTNGKSEEKHLCHACAEQLGYLNKIEEQRKEFDRLMQDSFVGMFAPLHAMSRVGSGGLLGGSLFGSSLLSDRFFDDFFAVPMLAGERVAQPSQEKQESLLNEEEQKDVGRQRELNALRAEMKQAVETENFYKLASANTEDATMLEITGGVGDFPESYEDMVLALNTGEVSGVIETTDYYYIFYCVTEFDVDATYSEFEGRYLAAKPRISFGSFLDGSYVQSFRNYFADTFPGREALLEDFASWDWVYTLGETEPTEVAE